MQSPEQKPNSPVIIGAAGDIGRSAIQQLVLEREVIPAGVILRKERLVTSSSREQTAQQIAENFHTEGIRPVFDEVHLTPKELIVNGITIPVFTGSSQHELLQEGHPVIDASGQHKKAEGLEPLLNDGASFVLVTGPMKDDSVTVVPGVNDSTEKYLQALDDGIISTSSCTTTCATSLSKPIIDALNPVSAQFTVLHSRTNSNTQEELRDTFKLSSSGATVEIPKILGIDPNKTSVSLQCSRANVSCGSLAIASFIISPEKTGISAEEAEITLLESLHHSSTNLEIDNSMNSTKSVIGRRASVIANLGQISVQTLPGGAGIHVSSICGYYDNVGGYTRSALDGFTSLDTAQNCTSNVVGAQT